jgi:hypothetical protein
VTILQGTMQDGTVLPVQVDAQGRLVAEGLQGVPGVDGLPGAPGVPGGSFELPPNPQDGEILGWESGALVWRQVPATYEAATVLPVEMVSCLVGWPGSDVNQLSGVEHALKAVAAPTWNSMAYDFNKGVRALRGVITPYPGGYVIFEWANALPGSQLRALIQGGGSAYNQGKMAVSGDIAPYTGDIWGGGGEGYYAMNFNIQDRSTGRIRFQPADGNIAPSIFFVGIIPPPAPAL